MASTLFTQNIIACVWDFDKTLIPAYMQAPLFRRYGVDEATFWAETNALGENYRRRGYHISPEISYLNHLLTYVMAGNMAGLNNKILRECGADIKFYPGLPKFFESSRAWAKAKPEYVKHDIKLEHYVVSTGLAEMVRGSALAPYIDAVWACEFIENPLQPGFLKQNEFPLEAASEIAQIGVMIDNTSKTRAIFEINKGTNRNPAIDVNAKVTPEDRRIPLQNMIYIADGPSDVPSFSVVKQGGGKTYAVYNPANRAEFEQNDRLRQNGRIDHYGPADYTENSATTNWLQLQVEKMCDRVVADREAALASRVARPPRHLNPSPEEEAARRAARGPKQSSFLE
ncbi:haloacid dehalogenase-like hydrolase [Oleiharenicola lentus]|uniref:haloacid dehalogenase-like hydrolase n=1 Tax=Oleiharenicola lentus TaxID=2508720 RepID=UPI003F674057